MNDVGGAAAGRAKAPKADPEEIKRRNQEALAKRKAALAASKSDEATRPLPEGWRRVESRSRPGEFVYENIHTEERQAWFPDAPAKEEGKPLPGPGPSFAIGCVARSRRRRCCAVQRQPRL